MIYNVAGMHEVGGRVNSDDAPIAPPEVLHEDALTVAHTHTTSRFRYYIHSTNTKQTSEQ